MRSYEVMFILDPTLETEAVGGIITRLNKVITDRGGSVENEDRWGKRRLAYEIAGHRDGDYTVMTFKGSAEIGAELERVMRITEGVIRYLLVLRDEAALAAAERAAAAPKRAPRRGTVSKPAQEAGAVAEAAESAEDSPTAEAAEAAVAAEEDAATAESPAPVEV